MTSGTKTKHPVPEAQFKKALQGKHRDQFEIIVHVTGDGRSLSDADVKAAVNREVGTTLDKNGWPKCSLEVVDRKEILDGTKRTDVFIQVVVTRMAESR
jgi:FlaG/FlaF family flagellin (archaellin)